MTARAIKAISVPRMARVTWYKHRASVLGIPGMFLLAAALLVLDSLLQRHWISSHHFTYCLAYGDNSTSSRCLTRYRRCCWNRSCCPSSSCWNRCRRRRHPRCRCRRPLS